MTTVLDRDLTVHLPSRYKLQWTFSTGHGWIRVFNSFEEAQAYALDTLDLANDPNVKGWKIVPADPDKKLSYTLEEYVDALRGFDWYFEYSDDGRVYRAGREKLATLEEVQRLIDPDKSIWKQYEKR